jgi:hypothetical protein
MDERPTLALAYHQFATREAHGASALYEELAEGVATDDAVLDILLDLPVDKRQPNLLFAAARQVAGTPAGYPQFRREFYDQLGEIVEIMRLRRTQTNEPGRCAVLYPFLAALPQPLALLEVGASAGLCLLLDRYGYSYNGIPTGNPDSELVIDCQVEGPWTPPRQQLTVAWRAGVDLNPLSVNTAEDVRWLETLVWPGQNDRLRRFHAAIDIARRDPPRVVRGDLNEDLASLAAGAPTDATLVIFHTAVLTYVSPAERVRFGEQVRQLGAVWISQEAQSVLPWIASPLDPLTSAEFVLAIDGQAVAITSPHGACMRTLLDPNQPNSSTEHPVHSRHSPSI